MFLLIENNIIVQQDMYLMPLLNRIGFINKDQYYNFKTGKIKTKFNHVKERFQIVHINQQEFFRNDMLWCPEYLEYEKYL